MMPVSETLRQIADGVSRGLEGYSCYEETEGGLAGFRLVYGICDGLKRAADNIDSILEVDFEEGEEVRVFDCMLSKLSIAPGDRLVLTTDQRLSDKACARIIEYVKKIFPDNQAILLEEDMKLGVLAALEKELVT